MMSWFRLEPKNRGADLGDLYWNPVPWISRLQGKRHPSLSRPIDPSHEIFRGKWEERNWRNVPGPIYGAMTDNCWVGRLSAPRHVLYGGDDDYDNEFLYRQPANPTELLAVLAGLQADPFAGWACDGDDHWTYELVRDWWSERARLNEWINRKTREWAASDSDDLLEVVAGLRDYEHYIAGELELTLRRYCFWLNEHRSPKPAEVLPDL